MTTTKIRGISLLRTFFSLDKSVLLHRKCLMSKFRETLILLCRKIFSVFIRFFTKLFPIAVVFNLLFKYLISSRSIYYRKHFYSILTNLSNFSHSKPSSQQVLWQSSDLMLKRFHKTLSNNVAVC